MDEGRLLASGRDADVFAVDATRVRRRYRDGGDVEPEVVIMTHVRRFGFPVPALYAASGAELVMERLEGPTMLAALASGECPLPRAAAILADLHDRLHRIPAPSGSDCAVVLHLDLHPANVMFGPAGPVVIDWRNADEGPADLDVAMSAVIIGEVAVEESHPLSGLAHTLLRAFLHQVDAGWSSASPEALTIRRTDRPLGEDELERLDAVGKLLEQIASYDRRP